MGDCPNFNHKSILYRTSYLGLFFREQFNFDTCVRSQNIKNYSEGPEPWTKNRNLDVLLSNTGSELTKLEGKADVDGLVQAS